MSGCCLCRCPVQQYLQFSITLFLFPLPFCHLLSSCFCLSLLSQTNSFASLKLSSTCFCILCASTLWAHNNIYWLFTSLVYFKAVNSLMIPSTMFSSSRPFMNCSSSLLWYSLHLQSVALIYNLPINSWVDPWLFLLSLQYCEDKIVS